MREPIPEDSPAHPVGALVHVCRLLVCEPWRREELLACLPALLSDYDKMNEKRAGVTDE